VRSEDEAVRSPLGALKTKRKAGDGQRPFIAKIAHPSPNTEGFQKCQKRVRVSTSEADHAGRTSSPSQSMSVAHHKTTNPYLASFLLSEGAVLAGVTRLGPKKVEFRFAADLTLHVLLRVYWSNQLILVVPARLFDAFRVLKSLGRQHP
jgi:hypothetical protein